MSKYIKIPVQKELMQANIIYFHKALEIIGDGKESKGKKIIMRQAKCSGTEIKKIGTIINGMITPSSHNVVFVNRHIDKPNIGFYYNSVKISCEKAECILRTMIEILDQKQNKNFIDCCKKYFDENNGLERTYLNAIMSSILKSWNDRQCEDLFFEYNNHLQDAVTISLSVYNSIVYLHKVERSLYET